MYYHGRIVPGGRTPTGAKIPYMRKKRKRELGRPPVETVIGELKVKKQRVRGGGVKLKLLSADFANVAIPSERKSIRARIIRVLSNPANPDYDRREVITRGAIIDTEVGKARVVSRPGQHGVINAILIEGAEREEER
uniref:Small ribosomal subunit protein eS8 n=1 Tax=uncultured korarchaeote TaxID=161241 RepID=A0A1L2JT49_9CREN|nr:ribosomal protein S8E [uncultured korarchaeote]